jgi:hypothetical protein
MNHVPSVLQHRETARTVSTGLLDAAQRLASAGSFDEFVAAVEAHRQAWSNIHSVAPTLGVVIPDEMMRFSLAAPQKIKKGLSDYEVEMLIRFDRMVSGAILEAVGDFAYSDRRSAY